MNSASGQTTQGPRMKEVYDYIEKQRTRRQSNRVLHAHPSPLFWLERDVPMKEVMIERRMASAAMPKRLNVYVGTPYCLPTNPERCGYCLFPSEVYQGQPQLDRYLKYLESEGRRYQHFLEGEQPAGIYFGGGTSNLYRPDDYHRLMRIVRDVFPTIPPGIEITLEGIPQLFTREKLAAMKAAGINRISMGVQQLDDEMIKLSGRKQKAKHALQTLQWCEELGLRSSVDLIFGWPQQTIELMLKDLEAIVRTGIGHITHYELNVAGRTDFARHRRDELPSTEQNLEMYRVSKQFLESHGYQQVTAYDWEKVAPELPGEYRFEENMRRAFTRDADHGIVGYDMWGWGFAGVTYFPGTPEMPGWIYMNSTKAGEYFGRLDESRFPTERGFHYTHKDLGIASLFQMLQSMSVDVALYNELFRFNLLEEYADIWQALVEKGWAEVDRNKVTLVGDGVFYTPLIQGLLAHERTEEMRRGKSSAPPVQEDAFLPAPQLPKNTPIGRELGTEEPRLSADLGSRSESVASDLRPMIPRRRELTTLTWYRELTSDRVELSLLRVYGDVWHDSPVVLSHGTFSNAQTCTRLATYLAENGFDCWVLELRGHGRSEVGPVHPDFERFSELDVPAALRAVRHNTRNKPLFWVGHSGGGLVLLMHLARHPEALAQVKGIVTLASQATDAGMTWSGWAKIALSAAGNNLLGYAPGPLFKLGPENEFRGVMNQWFRWNWNGRWTGHDGFDYLEGLGRITVPALCVAGGGDRFIAPYQGCRRLYNALGGPDKQMMFCAKSEGYGEDYSHARIITSRRAQQEIWPIISEWLAKRAN
jgi:oxygen-independent coproporphyrinogen III oxidase